MKVTALIPDGLVDEVKKLTGVSIIIALEDFTSCKRLMKTIQKIRKQPLTFWENY